MTVDSQAIKRTIPNLLPGNRYAVRVRALNEFGQYSTWSEALEIIADGGTEASVQLTAPSAPIVQALMGSILVTLNYTGESATIVSYVIEHSLDNINFTQLSASSNFSYVHQVSSGVTHYYRWRVVDVVGNLSPFSPSNSGQSLPFPDSFSYIHIQSVSASLWTVNHNLNKRCNVIVVDDSDNEIRGQLQYITDNQVTITFNNALTGRVYCN